MSKLRKLSWSIPITTFIFISIIWWVADDKTYCSLGFYTKSKDGFSATPDICMKDTHRTFDRYMILVLAVPIPITAINYYFVRQDMEKERNVSK